MATARRVYRIYETLGKNATEVRDFIAAKGEKVPGTVERLIARDRAMLLARWSDEMNELCGVLDGSHHDPYLMEATQTFYWASLFAVSSGSDWDSVKFDSGRRQASLCGIATVPELRAAVKRLIEMGADKAKPEKLFLLWNVADHLYREKTPTEKQWTLDQLMEADLQEMKKRKYLEPILSQIGD
jgi:hypothetical protein